MMKSCKRVMTVTLALGAVLASQIVAPAVAAEEQTVNAFAPYKGEGKIYRSGENMGTFVGAIVGELFVESKKGPRPAGRIVCPAMMQLNLENGKQAGTGQCTITAKDGAQGLAT